MEIKMFRSVWEMDTEEFKELNIKPCIGCGFCCLQAQCGVSYAAYGKRSRCPQLMWNGNRYVCGFAAQYFDSLFIGEGCCSNLNSWRREPLKER